MAGLIAIYARVSTEEQAKHGFGIAAQIRACKEMAKGEDVLVFSDEGVSGETLNCPALEELQRRLESAAFPCDLPRSDRLPVLLHQLLLTEDRERPGVELCL